MQKRRRMRITRPLSPIQFQVMPDGLGLGLLASMAYLLRPDPCRRARCRLSTAAVAIVRVGVFSTIFVARRGEPFSSVRPHWFVPARGHVCLCPGESAVLQYRRYVPSSLFQARYVCNLPLTLSGRDKKRGPRLAGRNRFPSLSAWSRGLPGQKAPQGYGNEFQSIETKP